MRIRYLRTLERIRNFLLAKNGREFLIFMFFVFVSFSFWLLQVLNDDYETELSIPLRMKNVPDNVVVTSELPKELKIGVYDRGTVLVNYLFGKTLYPVNLDFKDYEDKGNVLRIPSLSLQKRISSQLNQSTRFSTIKPDTLEFIYARGEAKKLPVRLVGHVSADRQHYISRQIFEPDSVMVYAPREILDTMTAAYTEVVNQVEIADTTRFRVDLQTVKGAKFVPAYNDVTLLVDMYSEKIVEVPVSGIHFPSDKILRTFPSKVKVTFQVGLTQFKNVTAKDFEVAVDYREIISDNKEKCRPILLEMPANVHNVRISPKEIDYIIEQQVLFND